MNILIFFSLIVKVFGSVIEIGSQALISQFWSIETYGTYSFFISLAEAFYALFFSAIIKFNNFYIPQKYSISSFKRKFYTRYAIPVFGVGFIAVCLLKRPQLIWTCIAGFLYFCAMDTSSKMMSHGKYKSALLGEYCIGRLFVIVFVAVTIIIPQHRVEYLYAIYALQYVVAIVFYKRINAMAKLSEEPANEQLPEHSAVKKYAIFQLTDIGHMVIMQTSVIIQYIFGGAYQTALVSIVLVVRKLINFITGPTSKLYQPEFAKKYNAGDRKGLQNVYAQITRTQLCFMMPVFTFLVARPELLLSVYNKSLVGHGNLVRGTAVVFLLMIAFGPLTNFLCMTGHEKSDSVSNWLSVAVMYLTMFLTRANSYFVVYGFCAQIIFSTLYKVVVYVKYMETLTMPFKDYVKLLLIFVVAILAMKVGPANIFYGIAICGIHFMADFLLVFPKNEFDELLTKLKLRRKRGYE